MAVIISFGSFLLWASVSDFPPLDSESLPELVCVIASDILAWPLLVVVLVLPESAAKIFALPAIILSGLFWAALLELFIVRNARRA
jgi:hypothetical protein